MIDKRNEFSFEGTWHCSCRPIWFTSCFPGISDQHMYLVCTRRTFFFQHSFPPFFIGFLTNSWKLLKWLTFASTCLLLDGLVTWTFTIKMEGNFTILSISYFEFVIPLLLFFLILIAKFFCTEMSQSELISYVEFAPFSSYKQMLNRKK